MCVREQRPRTTEKHARHKEAESTTQPNSNIKLEELRIGAAETEGHATVKAETADRGPHTEGRQGHEKDGTAPDEDTTRTRHTAVSAGARAEEIRLPGGRAGRRA